MTKLPTAQNISGGKPTKLRLAIVVPCYNEAEVLGTTILRMLALLNELKVN